MSKTLEAARRALELRRLARAAARAKFGRDDLVDITVALQDYADLLEGKSAKGRPSKSEDVQHRIGLALAWLNGHFDDLKQKQRNGIVVSVLNVKPRALTTLAARHTRPSADALSRWANSRDGDVITKALDRLAREGREKLRRLRG